MKRIKYILMVFLAMNIVACDTVDFGDTNKNVNAPSEPYSAGLLGGAIMSFATNTGRDGLLKPTLYVQYQSQVTYVDEMLYAETPSSWFTYYVNSLNGLQTVIDFLSDPNNISSTVLANGSVNNQIGVSMIMKAIIFKRVTDTWGDIPYSEALTGADHITPVYDKQQDIYKDLIATLKAGRDMLNSAEIAPYGDILYNGDVSKWAKLANSVIMQTAIQLSKTSDAGYAATEFNSALNDSHGIITTVADEAWFKFEDLAGFRNPWNANRTPDYFLSREFTDALNGFATSTNPITNSVQAFNPTSNHTFDARLEVYADDFTRNGVPYGYRAGSGAGAASVSNDNYWNNVTPLPLMTASYVFLNRADAANMGWTSENAATMLSQGITMSYRSLENLTAISEAKGVGTALTLDETAYVAARLADATTVGMGQVIAEEKWVSLFGMGFDAWAEWRRTGFPALAPATDFYNNGQIPRRYLYPIEEATLNPANYTDAVTRLAPGEDKGTSKVWWDN